MGGQAERELSPGRVSHYQDFSGIEVVALRDLGKVAVGVPNIFKCWGPASARITDPPVFYVPGGVALRSESRTEMSGVGEIVFCAPEPAVNVHGYRKWALGLGQANLGKLIGVGAVGHAGVSGRRRKRENVFGHNPQS